MAILPKAKRKGARGSTAVVRVKSVEQNFSLYEILEQLMNYKESEGLAEPTLYCYYQHLQYFTDFSGGDLSNEEVTLETFRDYISYMLQEIKVKPTTANVRIRTLRAFLRQAHQEGWIKEPIYERFKPVKTPEDEIKAFTPAEVKALLNQIDDSR